MGWWMGSGVVRGEVGDTGKDLGRGRGGILIVRVCFWRWPVCLAGGGEQRAKGWVKGRREGEEERWRDGQREGGKEEFRKEKEGGKGSKGVNGARAGDDVGGWRNCFNTVVCGTCLECLKCFS
jgi:hypothetical protein